MLSGLGQFTSLLPVFPTENLGEPEEGGLGLGSNKSELFRFRVGVLKSRRVVID